MAEPHIITLRKPVGPQGQEISELCLREPTAGEVLRASRETGRELALSLLKQVTGAPAGAIEALPGRVSNQALTYMMTFIQSILADPKEDTAEIADEMTVGLPDTLQLGTTWVTKLDLREPTLGELIKADKYSGMQRSIVLVSLVSGLPRSVIDFVPISAFAKAAEYVLGFTEGAPTGGAESSEL